MDEELHINTLHLAQFLINAQKEMYHEEKIESTTSQTKMFNFAQEYWRLEDLCTGYHQFVGHRTVYFNERPVWGMNFRGVTLDGYNSHIITEFLYQALQQDDNSVLPVRGPEQYSAVQFSYQNIQNGDLTNFHGEELILYSGNLAYKCLYHGGFIA
jgi:hypothetical protein